MNDLAFHLASPAFQRVQQKRLFGKPYIRLGPLVFTVGGWVFEQGALLGYGLKRQQEILAKLLGSPIGDELSFIRSIRNEAETRLRETPADKFNLFEMYVARELRLMGIDLPTSSPNKALDRKCDPLEVNVRVRSALKAGAALGRHFPEQFQACWENSHPILPAAEWQEMRAAGLGLPETQQENPLEEHLSIVLGITAAWAYEYGAQRFSPDELTLLARMAENPNAYLARY